MMRFATCVACLVALGPVTAGLAQSNNRPELSLLLGPAPYDLAGTGTGGAGRLGLSWGLADRVVVLEPSLGVFAASGNNLLLPEVSLEATAGRGRFRPYLGAGAGAAWAFDGNGPAWRATLHAMAGTRVDLPDGWGLRAELRARAVDPWIGETVDFAMGVTRDVF
jgi:hypothetical protein